MQRLIAVIFRHQFETSTQTVSVLDCVRTELIRLNEGNQRGFIRFSMREHFGYTRGCLVGRHWSCYKFEHAQCAPVLVEIRWMGSSWAWCAIKRRRDPGAVARWAARAGVCEA